MSDGPGAYGAAESRTRGWPRFGGMGIPAPAFPDDDGSADPVLAEALARYALGEAAPSDVVRALQGLRLMAPLMAVLDSLDEGGAPGEKDSHMATVSLVSPDGRRGMLAFTSTASMAAWDPMARGIPASSERVAAAALEEGADAVLLDLAGPVRFALQGDALRAVAEGVPWAPADEDPDVLAAVAEALAGLPGIARHAVSGSAAADVRVVLEIDPGADHATARTAAEDAGARLAEHPVLAALCPRGIELAVLER